MTVGDDYHVVFPYTPRRVTADGVGTLTLTPNEIMFHQPGGIYSCDPLSEQDARTIYIAISPDEAALVEGREANGGGTPWRGTLSAGLSLEAWRLAHELRGLEPARRDDLSYTERTARLLDATMSAVARRPERRQVGVRPATRQQHAQLAEAACEYLATCYASHSLPLARVARTIGASPFHLARVFRASTGSSLHEYRMQLRVRAVLAGLAERRSISELAVACGFSHPSHLSDLFRRVFGTSPSQLRNEMDAPRRT
jgi:AraC-like DNA-binding protein